MCRKIEYGCIEKGIGYFLKGNEPHPMVMPIVFTGCRCGSTIYGTVEGGTLWVEIEEDPNVNSATIKKFSADVVRAWTQTAGSGGVPANSPSGERVGNGD